MDMPIMKTNHGNTISANVSPFQAEWLKNQYPPPPLLTNIISTIVIPLKASRDLILFLVSFSSDDPIWLCLKDGSSYFAFSSAASIILISNRPSPAVLSDLASSSALFESHSDVIILASLNCSSLSTTNFDCSASCWATCLASTAYVNPLPKLRWVREKLRSQLSNIPMLTMKSCKSFGYRHFPVGGPCKSLIPKPRSFFERTFL